MVAYDGKGKSWPDGLGGLAEKMPVSPQSNPHLTEAGYSNWALIGCANADLAHELASVRFSGSCIELGSQRERSCCSITLFFDLKLIALRLRRICRRTNIYPSTLEEFPS